MKSELLQKFAEELKEQRILSEITLHQVYQKTRIDIKYLEAIECANFGIMPEVYMRAFIKEYSKAVNLNPEEILKKYDLAKIGKTEEDLKEIEESKSDKNVVDQKSDSGAEFNIRKVLTSLKINEIKSSYLLIGGALILFISSLIYFAFSEEEPKFIKEKSFDEILQEKEKESDVTRFVENENSKISSITEKSSPESKDSLILKVVASDTAWIRIITDGIINNEYTFFPGVKKIFKAESNFSLLLGNAGGVNVFLNDSLVNLNAKKGEIKNIRLDKDGFRFLKIEKKNSDVKESGDENSGTPQTN